MRVVDGGWLVYMGGYNIGLESRRAHKSCVFVKQQKVQKREGRRERSGQKKDINKGTAGLETSNYKHRVVLTV